MNNIELSNTSSQDLRAELRQLSEDLLSLDQSEMIRIISHDLLKLEDSKYRGGEPTGADSKILFLIGDDTNDVTRAKNLEGKEIYSNERDFPRPPEIAELTAAISRYDDEKRQNIAPVLSEVADLFYNSIQLIELDPKFGDEYRRWIDLFARGIGLDLKDLLGLAIIKYRKRLAPGVKKDVELEEELILECIKEDGNGGNFIVKKPSDDGLKKLYRIANLFQASVLRPRMIQLTGIKNAGRELDELL